jgi:putative endonuclease
MKQPVIYILSNESNTVIYVGVTSNIIKRIYQQKQKAEKLFSKRTT